MSRKPLDLGRADPRCAARWHGTDSAYKHGCRCPHAREAKRLRDKRRRENRAQPARLDGTGVARRLQALSAIGWRHADVAARLGTSWQFVQKLACRDNPTVERRTVSRVAAIYRDLSGRPGPSNLTRLYARRQGWLPPVAWGADIDDPGAAPWVGLEPGDGCSANTLVDIELVMAGKAPFSALHTNTERAAAVAAMRAAGRTRNHISRTCGLSHERIRKLEELAGEFRAGQVAA
jgi:uncharacterized protein involved in type VI secretion and phage assembly